LPADAFLPTAPAYGKGSLADLLPSVSAVLGVPGVTDVLGLGRYLSGIDRIAVLLVDGLGAYQLPVLRPCAPVLTELAAGGGGHAGTLTSGFPSTTPVSLATLGTGAPPGEHGIVGFTLRTPGGGVLNHIHWADDPDPYAWQALPTRHELAAAAGVRVTMVNRTEFQGTGLTVAVHRGADYVGVTSADELATGMLRALAVPGPALVYGYFGDLDRGGHEWGIDSEPWRDAARSLDVLLDRLVSGLPAGTALLVTADHGQLNVPYDQRFDLGPSPAGVVAVAGEPRARYLHTEPGAADDVIARCRGALGDAAWVLSRGEAIDGGWFGPVRAEHAARIGDVVIISLGRSVVLASGWEPPAVGSLIAYHGSVTAAEMTVPLLLACR
jgi:hypothetical protein